MEKLIYKVTLDHVNIELVKNAFGFCISVDFGYVMDVFCFNDLSVSLIAFERLVPTFLDEKYNKLS